MNVRVESTLQEAAEQCGRHILVRLEDAMSAGASPTLAISGGSSPKAMFEYFACAEFPWDRVHLFWVDERCVPMGDPQSNFKFAYDHWLGPAAFPQGNIHRVLTELGPQEAARRYAEDIASFFGYQGGELPRFEVIHRGMGPDAHTASLFAGEPLIADHVHIAAPVWVAKMNQWRVTLLPGMLEAARHTAVLVGGEDKIPALQAVLQGAGDPMQYPAQIAAKHAVWFLDRAAAGA
jgi:6-phosphogluconolactonase